MALSLGCGAIRIFFITLLIISYKYGIIQIVNLEYFWDNLLSYFAHDVAIDLGTANTLVHVKGKGIVVREPSIIARHKKKKTILAVGAEAKRMMGKTPGMIETIRPLKGGVITDFDVAAVLLSYLIKKVHKTYQLFPPKIPRPRVVVGIPSGVTEVERKAVVDACVKAGARKVYLLEEPMAAAIGAGLSVSEPRGSMVVDIGGGTSEIAVISLGGIVALRSVRVAGDEMDEAIISWARERYRLLIGESSAEEVKIAIGSAFPENSESQKTQRIRKSEDQKENQKVGESEGQRMQTLSLADSSDVLTHRFSDTPSSSEFSEYDLRGRDLRSGLPKKITITPEELREVLLDPIKIIIDNIKEVIEETPPELLSDLAKEGMVLAGGGAKIIGIDKLIAKEVHLPVRIADDSMTAVVRGCAKALEDLELLERVRIVGV